MFLEEDIIIKRIKLLLFILLFLTYSYFYQGGGHNSNTRINLTRAIAEEGRFTTDSFSLNTADVALYKGHTYCDKAPGTSFLGVVPFLFMTHTQKLLPDKFIKTWGDLLRNHFTVSISVSLLSAIASIFLFDLLGFYSSSISTRLFLTLGYSLGTPVFAYSTLYYGHQVAGSLFIIILFIIHKIVLGEIGFDKEWKYLLTTGLLSGYVVLSEYPAAPVVMIFTIYLFFKLLRKRRILYFIAGGMIIAVLMFSYNYICFENPVSVGYSTYGSSENPAWSQMTKGVMGIHLPQREVIYRLLFGTYRGLFYLSPFLLLSIPGFIFLFGLKEKRHIFYLTSTIVIYYICLNSGYGDSPVFWGGGVAMGPRHLVPMIPFLAIPIVLTLKRIKFFGIFLILLSISFVLMGVAVEPRAPYDFMNPLAHYYMTNFFRGELSKNIVTTFPPRFANREFVAYNIGEVFGLRGINSLIPLFSLWLLIAYLFTRSIVPKLEKPGKSFFIKVPLMTIIFISGTLYLHNLYSISDIGKAKGEQGLFGKYYENTDWNGNPHITRVDKRLDFIWDLNTGRPFPGAFSAEWEGYVLIPEDGEYEFATRSDDGSMLYINDKMLVDNGGMHGSRLKSEKINLDKGYHKIQVKFQDFGGGAVMELLWRQPGQIRDIIDSKNLLIGYDEKSD